MVFRRRWIAVVTAVGVLAGGAVCARGASWTWTADELRRIQSIEKHVTSDRKTGRYTLTVGRFNVVTDISPRFAAETSLFMDTFYDGFCRFVFDRLGVTVPPAPKRRVVFVVRDASGRVRPVPAQKTSDRIHFPKKPTVVIYKTPAQYGATFADGSGGVFLHRRDRKGRWTRFDIYTFARAQREWNFKAFNHSTLMHEGAHCMVRALAGKTEVPKWFDEGVAQLVECSLPRGVMRGEIKPVNGWWWRQQALKQPADGWYAHAPSLTKLLGVTQWNTDKMGYQTKYRYALAWNFVGYLFSSDEGRRSLGQMLGRLSRHESPLLTERDCWALEPSWHRHLKASLKPRRPGR